MPGCFVVKVFPNVSLNFFGLMTMSLYSKGVTNCCKALLVRQRFFLSSFEVTCDIVSWISIDTSRVSDNSYIFDNRKLQLLGEALESGHDETVLRG